MGFVKVNDYWVSKEDDSTGTSVGPSGGPSDGVGPSACVDEDYNMQVLVAYEPSVDHGIPMSQFKRLILNHMDTMASDKNKTL